MQGSFVFFIFLEFFLGFSLEVCEVWQTTLDKSSLISRLSDLSIITGESNDSIIVTINNTTYQEIYGFGGALTEASAYNLITLKSQYNSTYNKTLYNLFSPSDGAGFSVIRVPMGSCDFSLSPYFTFDDTPQDLLFEQFNWNRDNLYVIPVLKDILTVNPNIKILITPWTAPTWMKTSAGASNAFYYGSLADEYFDDFAYYFQMTIQKYKQLGIPIYALTLQNEPQNEPNSYPVMRLSSQNESVLAALLGPKLQNNSITTKILVWDHNWDNFNYPIEVLSDPKAYPYIAGSAFHCYAGNVASQSLVYNAYPDKEIWFTECSGTGPSNFESNIQWNTNNLYMGSIKNWARTVLHWNIALDANSGPHTGGCSNCRGVITVQGSNVTYNEEYYGLAMFSKFLSYPAFRLDCSLQGGSECVSVMCIKNGNGDVVVVVANFCQIPQNMAIQNGNSYVHTNVSVGLTSFIWHRVVIRNFGSCCFYPKVQLWVGLQLYLMIYQIYYGY